MQIGSDPFFSLFFKLGQYTCSPTDQAMTPIFKNSQTPSGGLVKKHGRVYENVRVKLNRL